jgi:hypothetical protein
MFATRLTLPGKIVISVGLVVGIPVHVTEVLEQLTMAYKVV